MWKYSVNASMYVVQYILCIDTACVHALTDEMKTLSSQAESILMNYIYFMLIMYVS